MIKLKDYLIYPATFVKEYNVQGEEVISSKIHTVSGDFFTMGFSLENVIKRSQAMIIDMAHVFAFEDHFPKASQFSLLKDEVDALDPEDGDENTMLLPQPLLASEVQEGAGLSLASLARAEETFSARAEVAIEISMITAWRIIVCNAILDQKVSLKALSRQLKWDKEQLEDILDFYSEATIAELQQIAGVLDLQVSLEK